MLISELSMEIPVVSERREVTPCVEDDFRSYYSRVPGRIKGLINVTNLISINNKEKRQILSALIRDYSSIRHHLFVMCEPCVLKEMQVIFLKDLKK